MPVKSWGCAVRQFSAAVVATAAALSLSPSAEAVTIYSDKTTFLTDTGATSATGPLPSLVSPTSGPVTVGSITFTAPTGMWFGAEFVSEQDWTTRLPGNDLAINDLENLNVGINSPVYSLGFDFVEPEFDPNINAPFVDSTFTVTMLLSGAPVDSFTFNAPNDIAAFVGMWSDSPFDRVEIRETVGGIENEFFGQFYTGTTLPPSDVPVPSTVALLGTGLAMLGLVRGPANRRLS